jgi:hypothetical protein
MLARGVGHTLAVNRIQYALTHSLVKNIRDIHGLSSDICKRGMNSVIIIWA